VLCYLYEIAVEKVEEIDATPSYCSAAAFINAGKAVLQGRVQQQHSRILVQYITP
jgi:hypothetical protein